MGFTHLRVIVVNIPTAPQKSKGVEMDSVGEVLATQV